MDKKLNPYIYDKCKKVGIDIELASFALVGENSNEKVYNFLKLNPTLRDVRNHFIDIFNNWKEIFQGTIFENYVDKDVALKFYDFKNKFFFDYYEDRVFTITSFNGCTGELLENPKLLIRKKGLNHAIEKELMYLNQIILLVTELSNYSFVTIGNFPKLSRRYLEFLNRIIIRINKQIKSVVLQNEKALFFEGINLDLIEKFNGKLKIDNHPNLARQYQALYNYMIYLMDNLPLYLMYKNKDDDINHYKVFDYDGKLELRLKNYVH